MNQNKCKQCNSDIRGFSKQQLCASCAAKLRNKIFGNPFKNKKHTIKTINKMKQILSKIRKRTKFYHCKCGKEIHKNTKQCQSCFLKRLHKNIKRIIKICIKKRGNYKKQNNPNWKGGWQNKLSKCISCGKTLKNLYAIRCKSCSKKGNLNKLFIDGRSYDKYPPEFNKKLKLGILHRDNYTCQKCHKKGRDIHHIDYNRFNCNQTNLITLCQKCNLRANFNRDYWFSFFTYIIRNYIYDSQN